MTRKPTKLKPAIEEITFVAERWSENEQRLLQVLARTRHLHVAHATFARIVKAEPEAIVMLIDGMRTIAESPGPAGAQR